MALIHSSCVELDGKGILILGPSGSGKSDLALRLIEHGAVLVSDDYVDVCEYNGKIVAKTAPNIAGMIEVRGVGLVEFEHKEHSTLFLALELSNYSQIDRIPDKQYFEIGKAKIAKYKIDPFAVSAIPKIKLLLK